MEKQTATATPLQRGLLIEADRVILPGTDLYYEVCRERLAREKIKLPREIFVRYLPGHSAARGMAALLEKLGCTADVPALTQECAAAYTEALAKSGGKMRDTAASFVREFAKRNIKVGLITVLPEEKAKALYADLLEELVVVVPEASTLTGVHGWEGWRRAARKLQIRERLCAAIASPISVRGALSSAMRVVVMSDPMLEHVDCGGADILTENFSTPLRTQILGLLKVDIAAP
jgi:beta-phosphoglucomutase-like phosphatase (HAD superfamily)